jgi:chaperonin cofactor prefoldin
MSDARIKHLIEEKTEERISSLERDLSELRSELDRIKASIVEKKTPPVRSPSK